MPTLKKELSLFGLTMIAIGSCIGSGIFMTPAKIAAELPDPTWIIAVWILGGIVALTGALTFAELGGLFPKAGGVYVFLKEAYGSLVAFLYGWVILMVITTGAIAALSVTFAQYLDSLLGFGEQFQIGVAMIAIVIVTAVNVLGVKTGEFFSNLFTTLKLLGILLIIILGILWAAPAEGLFESSTNTEKSLSSAFALALIGVLWSYGGWHHTSYLAGEAKNPKRDIPRAMIFGALIVTLTYVLSNIAYLNMLPIEQIAASDAVATDAVKTIIPNAAIMIALLIAISTFGTTGIYTLTAPRIYFAMAKDGVFFKRLAKLHPTYGTPMFAIILQSTWAIVLLRYWGTFYDLISYVVFMDWVFMTLAASSIFIFRQKMKTAERPYKTLLYPITPLIFIAISLWFIGSTLIGQPVQAIAGIVILLLGLPIYFYFKKNKKNGTDTKA